MTQSSSVLPDGQEQLASEAMDDVGVSEAKADEVSQESDHEGELPEGIKKRLGRQEKRHQKEIRMLQDHISDLHHRIPSAQQQEQSYAATESSGSVEDIVQKAVTHALRHKELEEQKNRESENAAYVHGKYRELRDDLDNASDKYDDFDEVVKSPDQAYTTAMHDASLLLPKHLRADVLYKLGKNKDELKRISKLHPLDQAQEMINLALAMASGGDGKNPQTQHKPLNPIKSMPVSSQKSISEKTPISDLRKQMKSWR